MGVIIGMDPHKRPATIEVTGEQAVVLAAGRYGTDKAGYARMLAAARTFTGRVWAVEGCNGAWARAPLTGKHAPRARVRRTG